MFTSESEHCENPCERAQKHSFIHCKVCRLLFRGRGCNEEEVPNPAMIRTEFTCSIPDFWVSAIAKLLVPSQIKGYRHVIRISIWFYRHDCWVPKNILMPSLEGSLQGDGVWFRVYVLWFCLNVMQHVKIVAGCSLNSWPWKKSHLTLLKYSDYLKAKRCFEILPRSCWALLPNSQNQKSRCRCVNFDTIFLAGFIMCVWSDTFTNSWP